jgi:hypothetical protein
LIWFDFGVLTPLSTIFQLYHGGLVYDWTLKYKLNHMVANGILLDVSVSSKTKHNKKNTATV